MKLQQILLFLFILSISSCKNNNNADKESILNTIKINSNKLQEEGYLSSLVKDFQIVPLETNDSSLILDIRKVMCYKDYIYILDKSTFRLLLFENNGKFIKQIGKRGQGPGEYLELLDFTIDTIGDRLLLADYRNTFLKPYFVNFVM